MIHQPLDWADAVLVIQHWADPPRSLAEGLSPISIGSTPLPGSSLGHDWGVTGGQWLQFWRRGWDLAAQEVTQYAPAIAAFSLASFSGGYWLQAPLSVTFDLRSPSFTPVADQAVSNRFTIPSVPIVLRSSQRLAAMATGVAPEVMPPEASGRW
ncbi:hypothetical protein [Trichothermofontia sp.]